MKTSINWLKHYVDIPWDAKELSSRLTGAGLVLMISLVSALKVVIP